MPALGLRRALALILALVSAGSLSAQLAPAPVSVSRAEAQGGVDKRLAGRAPATALSLFSTYVPPGRFVRNAGSWAADLDLSGVSVWNSANLDGTGGNRGYGTLVSRRHVIFATHFHPGPGSVLLFVGRDGVIVSRILRQVAVVGATDICVGVLDEDVPASVAVYPILPASYAPRPATSGSRLLPLLCFNQQRQALVHEWMEVPGNTTLHRPAIDPRRAPFAAPVIIGDSGAPIFLIQGRQPILLGCNHTAVTAPALAAFATEIEAVMRQLGGAPPTLKRTAWRE